MGCGPLALGLHAQMHSHLLEGHLQLPAQHNHSRICTGSTARKLAGNPDSPEIVIFLALISVAMMG